MRFSKLPSNPTLTTLMIFVPLKNHTPWFVLGLAKAISSVRTGKVCKNFRYEGSQWQMADPGLLLAHRHCVGTARLSWSPAPPYKQLLWLP